MNLVSYGAAQLEHMEHPLSRLKPIEPGDTCCNCGQDCDGEGFASGHFLAHRVNGHPFCARPGCYGPKLNEWEGMREGCRCGLRERRKNSESTF